MTQDYQAAEQLFTGKSEMAKLIQSLDWSKTPLGAIGTWSQSLRTTISLCLASNFPISIVWGDRCTQIYNDGYWPICGAKHPRSMGQDFRECWASAWDAIGEAFERALAGETSFLENQRIFLDRNGYLEETFFTFSFSPIHDETGGVGGLFHPVTEVTQQTLTERRLAVLQDLATQTTHARTVTETIAQIAQAIAQHPLDLPLTLLYLSDADGNLHLSESTGFAPTADRAIVEQVTAGMFPFAEVMQSKQSRVVEGLAAQWGDLACGVYPEPPHTAIVLPILLLGLEHPFGLLVAGVSSRRALDTPYRTFYDLLGDAVTSALSRAKTYEEERKRAEALAEIDRAKTVFFSNVSHEFRTPLTLMLSPLEELLHQLNDRLQPEERSSLQLVQRNGLRLQKLVNTLLDFSRIEAGRVQASYEATDLASYTAELASVFRSLIEQAGMRLAIDCATLPEAVYVDREMWEKIVLNLLSNAFKFTFAGEISVRLRWQNDHIELAVQDTGIGIPADEVPHLFERFHRVKGAQGRSFEGSGIGLSLVQELVKLHGGAIEVTSIEGSGSCFTVSIPTGTAHLPQDRIDATRTLASTASGTNAYLEEALKWLPEGDFRLEIEDFRLEDSSQNHPKSKLPNLNSKILLVDDNADMRDYVRRLLSPQYEVEAVSDGLAALASVRHAVPDLILTDVMMPHLDGFGLLRELRSHPDTREISIILLSARAGEEARVEGLAAGADDYLTKPFSARELLARVEACLKLAQLRQEATQQEQTLRREAETSKQQVETILSSIRDGFYVLDRDWRFTYVNDRIYEMVGIRREAMLGQSIWELFADLIDTEIYRQFQQTMTQRVFNQAEYFYPTLNRWYDHRVYPSEQGITVFAADITDRKVAELERERLLESEQQARSMAESAREEAQAANRIKDEFLAVLSHELRSPLNPILGWAKLLKTGNLDAAKTSQALTTIERNAKLQSELIEDLLDISRILQGKLRLNVSPIDLTTTIRGAIETVRLAAEAKSIALEAELDANVGQVAGDSTRLQQVVWNLLSNAVKFTPNGGQVAVRLVQVDNQAQITVTDNGKGIPANFLPYVFDYFRQEDGATTRKFGGLGLGLAIVRHLVELHGGTVQAESGGEGLGATFTVRLPLMPIQSTVSFDRPFSQASLNLDGIQVLVIDDEPDSREFVAFILEQAGASVTTASTASEGFLALTQSPPDILIGDIGMPDMDGYMLMQQIRSLPLEQGGQTKAIALTAYAAEFDRQQALQAGFQRHLAKPVEPDVLTREIVKLLNER